MRAFRIKNRWTHKLTSKKTLVPINKVVNQRDYVGVEKLLKFGFKTFDIYNGRQYDGIHRAEMYESFNGKWIRLTEDQIQDLRFCFLNK